MVDSGAHLFCGAKMYFRQLDQLTVNVSIAQVIDDEDWGTFLKDTLAISRRLGVAARVSMIYCVHAYPNARQRMAASDFLVRHRLEKMGRIAVVTDNTMVLGAMTAFTWMMPKVRMNAFRSTDAPAAFQWLREVGSFDEAQAKLAWVEAQTKLDMTARAAGPPSSRHVEPTKP